MKKEFSYYETLKMIEDIKTFFEGQLEARLGLIKVPCPLFLKTDSGLQDSLSGVEKAVCFSKDHEKYEVVHSLAKWKRDVLGKYSFPVHKGIYTDMKAIRKDEIVDEVHSLLVEQWDWEQVISREDRTIDFLKEIVRKIYKAIRQTEIHISRKYPSLKMDLPKTITFITSQELEDLYPDLSPKMREEKIVKEKKAVFIIGIGDQLKSGLKHDLRSPDYDDWSLDGDLLLYDKKIDRAVEMTSMGIRVDKEALLSQLEKSHCMSRSSLPYHQMILKEELPFTIGGGIGQSRILMFFLQKSHIAEVQASCWDKKTLLDLQPYKVL